MSVDVTFKIGGKAGQGMQVISYIMGKLFTRAGYHVFVNQDVMSRIRGGHNFSQIRIKHEPVYAPSQTVNVIIALDRESIDEHMPELIEGGVIIFDGERIDFKSDNPNFFSIPLERLAQEHGESKVMMNTVATGAAIALMGYELEELFQILEDRFRAKGREVVKNNISTAQAGYHYVQENFKGVCPCKVAPAPVPKKRRMLISGSEAIAIGAICSGLKFYAGYPMSPSTPIMEFIASKQEQYGIVVEQAEDEIAAINMVIGASFAGVRSMTATSGGGFCLMVEGLSLAGGTETPIVIVIGQRPGPATGLPTRTEQADLQFVLNAAHGEFPRAILVPGNAEQAFYLISKAFNLAEKYQTPVIVLGDQFLQDSYFTVDELNLSKIHIDRGEWLSDEEVRALGPYQYKRYTVTETGISPRIFPGQEDAVLYADSDEHTEEGHITESAQVRINMVSKRMRKLEGMREEMDLPELYPEDGWKDLLVGWGSTYGTIKEVVDILRTEGVNIAMLHFREVYPLKVQETSNILKKASKICVIENNFGGQFARLLHSETGISATHKILKFDGRPFTPQFLLNTIRKKIL